VVGGGTLLYGLYRVRPQRVLFFSRFFIKRYRFLAILIIKRVWSLHSSLELGVFFRRTEFPLLPTRPSTKALYNTFNIGLSKATNYNAGLEQSIDSRVRS